MSRHTGLSPTTGYVPAFPVLPFVVERRARGEDVLQDVPAAVDDVDDGRPALRVGPLRRRGVA